MSTVAPNPPYRSLWAIPWVGLANLWRWAKKWGELPLPRPYHGQPRGVLQASTLCGCFYCLSNFSPHYIKEYVGKEETGVCPQCGVDSILGDACGLPVDRAFLAKLQDHWFAGKQKPERANNDRS